MDSVHENTMLVCLKVCLNLIIISPPTYYVTGQSQWQCPTCAQKEREANSPKRGAARRGANHLAKELLPAHGELQHTIFNEVTVNDDLVRSARSLRRRKTSSVEVEDHVPVLRKRQRRTPYRSETSAARDLVTTDYLDGSAEASGSLSPVRTRSRHARTTDREQCRVVQRQFERLVLSIRIDRNELSKIVKSSRSRQPNRGGRRNPKRRQPVHQPETQTHFARINPVSNISFHSGHDRGSDGLKSKPYGGILSETDGDTTRTLPGQVDRERFEQARQKAEDEWQARVREAEMSGEAVQRAAPKVSGPPSKIKYINFGGYEIETWYAAPYPEEYSRNRVLYI